MRPIEVAFGCRRRGRTGPRTQVWAASITAGAVLALALAGTAAVAASQAGSKKGWHRCEVAWSVTDLEGRTTKHLGSLCDRRGRVIFPFVFDFSEQSGYRALVTGFRRTRPRSGIADVRGEWYTISAGECGAYGAVEGCVEWSGLTRIRYATRDRGHHWLPVRFHRHVEKWEQANDETPGVVTYASDQDLPTRPCHWVHMRNRDEVDGKRHGFGNWCSPKGAWQLPADAPSENRAHSHTARPRQVR